MARNLGIFSKQKMQISYFMVQFEDDEYLYMTERGNYMPPVKALGMYGEKNKRFSDVIEAYMKLARVDYKKLMEKVGRHSSTFYKRRDEPERMTVSELRAFIKVLKIPEEEVLDFLYDKREVKKE